MTRDLLNTLPTPVLILVVVGGSTAVAVVLAYAVRRRYPRIAESGFEELTGVLRADVFALLYTIVLALVIADQSGNLASASDTVSLESSALAEMTIGLQTVPAPERKPLTDAMEEYLHAVVDEEFPAMRVGESSPRAAAALEALYQAYLTHEPQPGSESIFYERSVENLGKIVLHRRERLQESEEGLSPLLRTLLVVGAVVFMVLAYPASVPQLSLQLVIVAATAAFVSFAYLLTMVFDYPYAGSVSVNSEPYRAGALGQFWYAEIPARPLDSKDLGRLQAGDLIGKWDSDQAFGTMVFWAVGDDIRGVYRIEDGSVIGRVENGVFRGWWCQVPSRRPPDDAGEVEWRLLKDPDSEAVRLDGRWRYGTEGPMKGGWDLTKIGGLEPADLVEAMGDASRFCPHP